MVYLNTWYKCYTETQKPAEDDDWSFFDTILDGRDFVLKGDEVDQSLVMGGGVVDLPNGNTMTIDDLIDNLVRRRRRRRKTIKHKKEEKNPLFSVPVFSRMQRVRMIRSLPALKRHNDQQQQR